MANLISPGVSVTVTDESAYAPSGAGTVPMMVVASAENKLNGSGSDIAPGTLKENAGKTYLMTSQRDLVNTFGAPTFYKSSSGTPLHGYELNEYGLEAARSYLGLANRAYVIRADVNLAELNATSAIPTSAPKNGTYWLDLNETTWGLNVWNGSEFEHVQPIVVDDDQEVEAGKPKSEIGRQGQYAILTHEASNTVYYKPDSEWIEVGSTEWINELNSKVPVTVNGGTGTGAQVESVEYNSQGQVTKITFSNGGNGYVTGDDLTITRGTDTSDTFNPAVDGALTELTGLTLNFKTWDQTDVTVTSGKFVITGADSSYINKAYELVDDTGTTNTVIAVFDIIGVDGTTLTIEVSSGSIDFDNLPTTYLIRNVNVRSQQSSYVSDPSKKWSNSGAVAGSVWQKFGNVPNSAGFLMKLYSDSTKLFRTVASSTHDNIFNATSMLGGNNPSDIETGTVIFEYGSPSLTTNGLGVLAWRRENTGATVATGDTASDISGSLTVTDKFNGDTFSPTINNNSSVETVVGQINNSGRFEYVDFSVQDGNFVATHIKGGDIVFEGTALSDLFGTDHNLHNFNNSRFSGSTVGNSLVASNWEPLTYEANYSEPSQSPENGQLWYDSNLSADIMVNDEGQWKGYKQVTDDFRGVALSLTSDNGPIFSSTEPDTSDYNEGQLWIDTSDLENYPRIHRLVDGDPSEWRLIDNSDQHTSNGIVFADARWSTDGGDDPSSIGDLLMSDFVDPDAPNPALYPDGILLFNTRRSGFNVKEYRKNDISVKRYPDGNPRYTSHSSVSGYYPDRWVSKAGNQTNGAGYFGRKAQRRVIVRAMKSAVDSSFDIREEQRVFNLLAAPGYPELISNLVSVNVDRKETGHVIGDTPFRLSDNAADIQAWSKNSNAATDNGEDGLVTNNAYMSVYYPSGLSNDLTGSQIVVPPSHMILRTIAYNDNVSYPWFAAAGVNRGRISNANSIGFIDSDSGEYRSIAVREGLRDVLYFDNINPITFINGSGLVNYGNKTRLGVATALDRVNVARLVSYIRYVLDIAAKPFIFEPNDAQTRNEIRGVFESFFNDMMAKRAISDYLVIADESNNTPARIDRNELWVDCAIVPTKSVEFIYIPIRLRNTDEI